MTFVSVGNAVQPFRRLIEAVECHAADMPQPVIVQSGHTPMSSSSALQVVKFVEMSEFVRLVNGCDLLIMHAGAGSVIHALSTGKVPIVMARRAKLGEMVDDHQVELAGELERAGRLVQAQGIEDLGIVMSQLRGRSTKLSTSEEPSRMVDLVRRSLENCALRLKSGARHER